MNEITLIVTVSGIIFFSPFLSKFTRLPTSVIEIVAGTFLGSLGFLPHIHLFELIAEFGFLYLMFLAGVEVDLRHIATLSRPILKRGALYILLLYLFSFLIAKNLGFSDIFIAILPLISVGLIAALKKEYKNIEWLNLSLAVGTLGEIVSIALLTILSAFMEFGLGSNFYKSIIMLLLFLVAVLIVFKILQVLFWWYPELKTYLMPRIDTEEQDIRLSMALFFSFLALMLYLHLEVAFGAFIAGIFIATFFEHKRSLPHKLSSFGFGFLVPIFFIFTGSSFKISSLFIDGLIVSALIITALMFLIRFLASLIFLKVFSFKEIIAFSFSHSMPLTLLVAIATIAYHSKVIDEFEYMAFILASILEVIFAMIAIRLLMRKQPLAH